MTDVTAVVECENGPFFVKAVPNRPGGRRDSLVREGEINPHVRPLSPAVLWRAEDSEWVALGFEPIHGRRANFRPGSEDLPTLVDLVNRIGALPLPDVAHDWTETRWDRFVSDEAETPLLRGNSMLYVDINPSNFVIGEDNAWVVDWAWPTRGAAFIDPALLVVQLIAAKRNPADAEAWAGKCDAWTHADSDAVNVFVAATVRMYRAHAERFPDQPWRKAMVDAVESWAEHRGVTVPAA
ncbi:protein kinase [Haloactinospora alba]|nr:protein kinase [Haloactinospora alba]